MRPNEKPMMYQIRFAGLLDERWRRWFEGLDISHKANGETVITGAMDQAALHGILNRIRDLGMEMISVERSENPDELQHTKE